MNDKTPEPVVPGSIMTFRIMILLGGVQGHCEIHGFLDKKVLRYNIIIYQSFEYSMSINTEDLTVSTSYV